MSGSGNPSGPSSSGDEGWTQGADDAFESLNYSVATAA